MKFCVLVASSDKGRDIFETCFRHADLTWGRFDWPRYVGFTTGCYYGFKGFWALAATKPSTWQGELRDQLDQLPSNVEYVLLLLEDAFVTWVPILDLYRIAAFIEERDLAYVSLIALRRNFVGLVIESVRRILSDSAFRKLSPSEPYYSSFGVGIWRRSHLRWLLSQPGSIWDLEHTVTPEPHYAVWKTVFSPDHLVIKGKWARRAKRKLQLMEPARGFRSRWEWIRDLREWIVFSTVGFLSFRIRRRLGKISHR